jgi:hypothetical protein
MTLAETARAMALCDSRTRDRALFGSWVTTHYPMFCWASQLRFPPSDLVALDAWGLIFAL